MEHKSSTFKSDDSVYYQGEGRGPWPLPCCVVSCCLLRCALPLSSGAWSLSYYVRQSMQVVEGLPSSNIWAMLPRSKGASGNSLQYLHICFRFENMVLLLSGCFWRYFSCWLTILPFFRSIDRMSQTHFVSCVLRFSCFSEESILVIDQLGLWYTTLLKCGVCVPLFQWERSIIAFSSFWCQNN